MLRRTLVEFHFSGSFLFCYWSYCFQSPKCKCSLFLLNTHVPYPATTQWLKSKWLSNHASSVQLFWVGLRIECLHMRRLLTWLPFLKACHEYRRIPGILYLPGHISQKNGGCHGHKTNILSIPVPRADREVNLDQLYVHGWDHQCVYSRWAE